MHADLTPLIVGGLVFVASLISLKIGFSAGITEIILGAIVGNVGLRPEERITYRAGFGGIIPTFLAGTEIDTRLPLYERRI